MREIAPTGFLAVPRIWEKFYSEIMIRLKNATAFERRAYALPSASATRSPRAGSRASRCRCPYDRLLAGARARAEQLRKAIGIHRCRWIATGAAPISPDLLRWYMALGMEVIEIYGMTEASGAITTNPLGRPRPGTVGAAGRTARWRSRRRARSWCAASTCSMGYLNLPDKTAETVVDGWLHTGDVGNFDDDGYLRITDRLKDIIITAGGKNITPSEFENQLKFSPYITDAVVIGDRRPYLTCLVMIDHDNVEKYAQDHDVPFTNFTSLCRAPEVRELIQAEIDKVNAGFARVEQIKRFSLIEHKLTAEDEELTPTMKLKRKFVNEKYRPLIESMYRTPVPSEPCIQLNLERRLT